MFFPQDINIFMLCGGWIRGACAAVYIISERTLSFTVFCTPSRSCHSLLNDTHCSRAELIVRFPCPQRTLLAIAISVEVLCESMNLFHLEVHTITVETFTNGCWARKVCRNYLHLWHLISHGDACSGVHSAPTAQGCGDAIGQLKHLVS